MKYSLSRLIKNIKFLMRYDLKEREELLLDATEDLYRYEFSKEADDKFLKVLSPIDTISLLIENPKSFCRFGDGELEIVKGNSIPFQKYDARLSNILKEILKNENPNLYVGINHYYFNSNKILNDFNRMFNKRNAKDYRKVLLRLCKADNSYIATEFNQTYAMLSEKFDFENYYRKVKCLFEGRELIIFSGDNVLKKIIF